MFQLNPALQLLRYECIIVYFWIMSLWSGVTYYAKLILLQHFHESIGMGCRSLLFIVIIGQWYTLHRGAYYMIQPYIRFAGIVSNDLQNSRLSILPWKSEIKNTFKRHYNWFAVSHVHLQTSLRSQVRLYFRYLRKELIKSRGFYLQITPHFKTLSHFTFILSTHYTCYKPERVI